MSDAFVFDQTELWIVLVSIIYFAPDMFITEA